jgi:hypothetical protein
VSIKDRQFSLDLFTTAFLTFQWVILLAHGADHFKFLLARLANIFIDGHEIHLAFERVLGRFYPQRPAIFTAFMFENFVYSCYSKALTH